MIKKCLQLTFLSIVFSCNTVFADNEATVEMLAQASEAIREEIRELQDLLNDKIKKVEDNISVLAGKNNSTKPKTFFDIFSAKIGADYQKKYLHIKIPFRLIDHAYHMFNFKIRGYAFGCSKPINATFVGYLYGKPGSNSFIHQDASGTFNPAMYITNEKELVLRLETDSSLYVWNFTVDYYDGAYHIDQWGHYGMGYNSREDFVKNASRDIKFLTSDLDKLNSAAF